MRILLILALIFFLAACGNRSNKPDISHIKVDMTLERFEPALFSVDTNNLETSLFELYRSFPDFYQLYMDEILLLRGGHRVESNRITLNSEATGIFTFFLRSYAPVYDSLSEKYRSLNWFRNEAQQGFRFVRHYFPGFETPRLISFIATFDSPGAIMTPKYLGIGLHQYAGKDFSIYQQLLDIYPQYISRRFDREYMIANAFRAVVDDIYPDRSAGRPLVEQMIEKGKQWFLLHRFLPDEPDSVKTGFTGRQLEWVDRNEGNIWAYFQKNTDLYTINVEIIQDFIGEAPATRVMSDAAPGNIGQWVGWRIVESYARRNPELSVSELVRQDARQIFEGAGYRPK